ncbi:LuxR C-terminal-related transcriptional regulator [Saccharopolyspora taberi]|uniref:HTH luxR-type domain-containing protein n=1 Tax=Saccharopolyspora taberi TaxID=60895 RepID=A0ABN3VKS2_9PSEU
MEVVNGPPTAVPGEVISGGQGLTGLAERARLAGGLLHANPTPDGGFRLAAVFPYVPGEGALARQEPDAPAADGNRLPEDLASTFSNERNVGKVLGWTLVGTALIALAALVAAAVVLFNGRRRFPAQGLRPPPTSSAPCAPRRRARRTCRRVRPARSRTHWPQATRRSAPTRPVAGWRKLTDREGALLAEGLSNAAIGRRITMSEATVKTYVSRILTKLGCENRMQAALLARDADLGA